MNVVAVDYLVCVAFCFDCFIILLVPISWHISKSVNIKKIDGVKMM